MGGQEYGKNRQKVVEICGGAIEAAVAIGSAAIISRLAFSTRTKQKIKDRDGNKSVVSGKTENLECAHIDHSSGTHYNTVKNGRLLTRDEHFFDHFDRHGNNGLTPAQNRWTLRAIWGRMSHEEKKKVIDDGRIFGGYVETE